MTEVEPADHARLLQSKRAECSSIVTSRKRKLRELFAVATSTDGIPNLDLRDPDAPPTAPAELKFLFESDILQGHKFNELIIPPRPQFRIHPSIRPPSDSRPSPNENAPRVTAKKGQGHGTKSPWTHVTDGPDALDATLRPKNSQPGHPIPSTPSGSSALSPKPLRPVIPSPAVNGDSSLQHDSRPSRPPVLAGHDPSETPSQPEKSTAKEDAGPVSETRPGSIAPVAPPNPDRSSSEVTDNARFSQTHNPLLGTTLAKDYGKDVVETDASPVANKRADTLVVPITLQVGDSSRVADLISSPGSTAQSATTPAVHEASTDTSPDNETSQYTGEDDDQVGPPKALASHSVSEKPRQVSNVGDTTRVEGLSSPTEPHGGTSSGPEAQLLEESAAAAAGLSLPGGGLGGGRGTQQSSTGGALSRNQLTDGKAIITKSGINVSPTKLLEERVSLQDGDHQPSKAGQRPDRSHSHEEASETPMNVDQPTTTKPAATPELPKPPQDILPGSRVTKERILDATEAITVVDGAASLLSPVIKKGPAPTTARHPPTAPRPLQLETDAVDAAHENIGRMTSHSRVQSVDSKRRLTDKSKVPTVVFGKQPKRSDEHALVPTRTGPGQLPTDDYFTPLFVQGFAQSSKWMKTIDVLLHQAHKTVSTPDQYVSILDAQACRILRRVYHLQQHDKWALRQPSRCAEPTRQPSHWDVVLQEMKWMRTDFREERKWKRAVARNLASACAMWVASTPEERKALQVNTLPPSAGDETTDVSMAGATDGLDDSMPDLTHSGDTASPVEHDEPIDALVETVAPSAIFALQEDDVVFGLHRSPTSDKLLEELPMYGSPLNVPKFDLKGPEYDPDAAWKRPAVPLSKYVEGRMILASKPPPALRSRYQYDAEETDDEDDETVFGRKPNKRLKLDPQNANVALFNPEMKPIRDRLHAGHQFRPPTEFPMPLQSFFECRVASQWTWAEDDELKSLVREYSYNWSLISSMISTKSSFASGAERRTPWECFERWVNLEGLPNDMAKTQYFKTWQNRIEAANRAILQQIQNAQQQVGPNGVVTPAARRRPPLAMRVERRRNQKHLALIDAMRKLAKKREATVQKQQHAANLAAARKANEVQLPRAPVKTPKEYSLMRWERDQALAEKMAQYAQRQQEAQRRAMQGRTQGQGQAAQIAAVANGAAPVPPNAAQLAAANPLPSANRLNVPGQLAVPAGARPARIPVATAVGPGGVPVRMPGGFALPLNGNPQAQFQLPQAQQPLPMVSPQTNMMLLMQARQVQEQQRQAVQLQQQQQQQHNPHQQQGQLASQQQQVQQVPQVPQIPQMPQVLQAPQVPPQANGTAQTSPTSMRNAINGINQQNYSANAQALMAAQFNGINGAGMATSPGAGLAMAAVPGGSPRVSVIPPQKFPGVSVAQVQELEAQLRAKNPNLTAEQARHLAHEHVARIFVQQRQQQQQQQQMNQSAMNAAAGGPAQPPMQIPNGMSATTSPHQYAQLLRAQQQAQAQAAAAQQAGQHQRNSSGSAASVAGK